MTSHMLSVNIAPQTNNCLLPAEVTQYAVFHLPPYAIRQKGSVTQVTILLLTRWDETKWPPSCRRYFLERKCLNFDSNFTEICSQWFNLPWVCIGSDNGLAPNRRQAIILANDGLEHRRISASLHLNELTHWRCGCDIRLVNFYLISRINILNISCEIALGWMPQDFTCHKSKLVQIMSLGNKSFPGPVLTKTVWCHQAIVH